MPARTKQVRVRRTLHVEDINGAPVTFTLRRDWTQTTVVFVGPQEDANYEVYPLTRGLELFQSERAAATGQRLAKVDGYDRWQQPMQRLAQMRFGAETERRIVDFINTFHLQHISGEVQEGRKAKEVQRLGAERELATIPLLTVQGLLNSRWSEAPGTPTSLLVEYVGKTRTGGARLRLTVPRDPTRGLQNDVKVDFTQGQLLANPTGVQVSHPSLERSLVALDQLAEQGAQLDGLGASTPKNRVRVHDVDGRRWQARFYRENAYTHVEYRPMVGNNFDGWGTGDYFAGDVRAWPVSHEGKSGFVVMQYEPTGYNAGTYYPLLSEEEADKVAAVGRAFNDYYDTGKAREDRVAARERALGPAVLVGTLAVWRNPFPHDANVSIAPQEKLDVFVFPESGTDTLRLQSPNSATREALYVSAQTLTTRYATSPFTTTRERVEQRNRNHLILVYPVGMETYDLGDGVARVGLYATQSDVYDIVWKAWQAHQKGWNQPSGAKAASNFPFDVTLEQRDSKGNVLATANARIEYHRSQSGPRFEVTVNAATTPGPWGRRMKNRDSYWATASGTPRTYYTDAKNLQLHDFLFAAEPWKDPRSVELGPPITQDGKPLTWTEAPGAHLSKDSYARVLVAIDARMEAGLKGLGALPIGEPEYVGSFEVQENMEYPGHTIGNEVATVDGGREGGAVHRGLQPLLPRG